MLSKNDIKHYSDLSYHLAVEQINFLSFSKKNNVEETYSYRIFGSLIEVFWSLGIANEKDLIKSLRNKIENNKKFLAISNIDIIFLDILIALSEKDYEKASEEWSLQ